MIALLYSSKSGLFRKCKYSPIYYILYIIAVLLIQVIYNLLPSAVFPVSVFPAATEDSK